MIDEINKQRIALLHPSIRESAINIIIAANESLGPNITVRITQTLRTFPEQEIIYNQGRFGNKGPIVTNAKPGYSFHNYGLAMDYCLLINNTQISWDIYKDANKNGVSDWTEVANKAKKEGWKWGGDFKTFKDYPHLEKSFGYSEQKLLQKYRDKQFIPGTNYVKL